MIRFDGIRSSLLALAIGLSSAATTAQTPAEVSGVEFSAPETIEWSPVVGADFYNVYRGELTGLTAGVPGRCHAHPLSSTSLDSASSPEPGGGYFYLVTAESDASGEGAPGIDSLGTARDLLGSCRAVMRNHALDRAGYGWNEEAQASIELLGMQGYLDQQLDPDTIDESTNFALKDRQALYVPPASVIEMIALELINATYARRQLEQQAAMFWFNHFNTDWSKVTDVYLGAFPNCAQQSVPQCDAAYPTRAYLEGTTALYDDLEEYRDLAFNGTFREILEASFISNAMIIYLDTRGSVVGNPNENYPRELLELHTMGVNGGYTQTDIEEMARVFTGWGLCKKATADLDDPLAPCIDEYWEATPAGAIVPTLTLGQHDCGEKTIFDGTPYKITISDSCSTPADGLNDIYTIFDELAEHPSTKQFLSRKILEKFVTEEPEGWMVDTLVAAWNNAANPQGVGDLREILRTALDLESFLDPDRARSKVKTPFEQLASALRAVRGSSDGITEVLNFLIAAQEIPFYNPVPTGYDEIGASWIDTNNTLTRQNFGLALASSTDTFFGSDPISLLTDNGISVAPGNAAAIVDFFSNVLFGGALTPAQRLAAIEFLETDNLGTPSAYDDARIRNTVGVMLGFPQFQEQ